MRRLATAVALTIVCASTAFGASARWNCLGAEHRFMLDTSNYGIYPARMFMFSDALWIIPDIPGGAGIPDNMMSGLLVTRGEQAYAVHYNLPGTVGFGALRRGMGQAGGTLAQVANNLRPVPDLFYARKMDRMTVAGRFVLGLASREPVADKQAGGISVDLAGGVLMPTGMGDLDVGLRVSMASFADDALDIESTGGMGVNMDARLMMDRGNGAFLIPVAGLAFGSIPTIDGQRDEISHLAVDVGLGYNKRGDDNSMLVYGATLMYHSETHSPQTGSDVSINTLEFAYLSGYEKPLNDWLVGRGGARATITHVSGDQTAANRTSSDFYYNFGIRTIYKRVLIDFQLDRGLLNRGPYMLTGAGGRWSPNVCATFLL